MIVVLFSIFISIWTIFNISNWKKNKVIIHDIISYYSYLPATFIYHDLSFEFVDNMPKDFTGTIWYLKAPNGARVQKMSMGLSVMYSPFFFIGHQIAKLSSFPADGYTQPYQFMLVLSSLFYLFWGLFVLRKTLLRFFDDKTTTLTLLVLFFGTNLFFYATNESPMSHVYSFFLFVMVINFTIKWHESQSFLNTIIIGILGGLIVLIRPSNIIILLVPFFYGIYNRETLTAKANLLLEKWFHLVIVVILIILFFFPQMLYWKVITGNSLYYSYGDESFYFTHPQILKGLFSFRKGWLVYTPLMILSIAGIPFLFKQLKFLAIPILLFFVINIYIVFSWWCWWYGGSFGMRSLIESYAVLSIPLALFIKYIFNKKLWIKAIVSILIFLFLSLNLFQTLQYRRTIIHWDSMTKEAYFKTFGKLKFPENYWELIQTPDYKNARLGVKEMPE